MKETQKLNDLVPELDPQELRCFPNEIKVQRPLQELFREYMECYLTMLKEFDSSPSKNTNMKVPPDNVLTLASPFA